MINIATFKTEFGHLYALQCVDADEYLITITDANENETYDLHKILRVGKTNTFTMIDVSDAHQINEQYLKTSLYLPTDGSRSSLVMRRDNGTCTKFFDDRAECLIQAATIIVADEWDYTLSEVKFIKG